MRGRFRSFGKTVVVSLAFVNTIICTTTPRKSAKRATQQSPRGSTEQNFEKIDMVFTVGATVEVGSGSQLPCYNIIDMIYREQIWLEVLPLAGWNSMAQRSTRGRQAHLQHVRASTPRPGQQCQCCTGVIKTRPGRDSCRQVDSQLKKQHRLGACSLLKHTCVVIDAATRGTEGTAAPIRKCDAMCVTIAVGALDRSSSLMPSL